MDKRRCFILGAGFSHCCGLPLACELTQLVFRRMWAQDPLDCSPSAPLVGPNDVAYEAKENALRVIRLLFPISTCRRNFDTDWPDFEALITALDEATRFQNQVEAVTGVHGNQWASALKRSFVKHLGYLLGERIKNASVDGLGHIERFLGSLKPKRDRIICFNWDTLVEVASQKTGTAVSCRSDEDQIIGVAKPHGSLDHAEVPTGDYKKWKNSNSNVHGLEEVDCYSVEGVPHVLLRAHDPREVLDRVVGPFSENTLVEPNLRKQYLSPWVSKQWTSALRMVRSAETIYLLGYSLPEADLRPQLLLQLAGVKRSNPPQVVVVDPRPDCIVKRVWNATGVEPKQYAKRWEEWFQEDFET